MKKRGEIRKAIRVGVKNKVMLKQILVLLIFTITISTTVFSQTVNDIPISEIDVEYVQIVGRSRLLSTKFSIEIDFGQRDKIFNVKDTMVKDENGKLASFNSMIDALNFMSKNGYDFVNAHTIATSSYSIYYYLLKKRKE